MKKRKISTSFSASMSDCTSTETEKFLRAKLKVFYIGETADKRKFSNEMAEKLVKTLPYTPIVSYYDEYKEDFIGHASEQAIYGIVDPRGEISFVEEDGVKWVVCDVVLYTDRPDMVGTIAQKIVGKQQSLELDPATVKYNIEFDSKRNIKSIEFTDGEFVGVSVLGDSQNPAFTGSAFFEINEDFENKMSLLKNYCTRSEESVEEQVVEHATLTSFLERSWGDKSRILQEIGWTLDRFVQAIYDEYVILGDYWTGQLFKHSYTIQEDGSCKLGDGVPVLIQYVEVPQTETVEVEETQAEVQLEETFSDNNDTEVVQEEVIEVQEEEVVDEKPEQFEETEITEEQNVEEEIEETEEVSEETESQENFEDQQEIEQEDEDEEVLPESSALDNSQEAELNAFKRQEKEAIVTRFKEFLTEEEFSNYNSNLENFNKEKLESELALLCFDRVRKTEKPKVRIYRGQTENNESVFMTEEERLQAVLKRYNN